MATLFTDDFNSYNDGDLNGQGGWDASASVDVQGDVVLEGAKAIKIATAGHYARKTVDGITDGKVTFYARLESGGSNACQIGLQDSSGNWRIVVAIGPAADTTNLKYYDGAQWLFIGGEGDFTADVYHSIEIEFRSSDHLARYRLDEGTWTDWDTTQTQWTTVTRLMFYRYGSQTGAALAYFDYIAEEPYPSGPTNYTATLTGSATITGTLTITGKYHITVNKDNDNH